MALARALRVSVEHLTETAQRANSLYRLAKVILKDDGQERRVYEALEPLYSLQQRILNVLLQRVEFPEYLMGGIADPNRMRGFVRNAAQHAGSAILISEDASDFFPSITSAQITTVFQHVFRFPPEVASLLAILCTKDRVLPQGGSPSTYLANLVLFRKEPMLAAEFSAEGLLYSRFIDDMYVSSRHRLPKRDIHRTVVRLRGLLEANGFKANRRKQEIAGRGRRRLAHNLNVDAKNPTVPQDERKNIRAAVAALEWRARNGCDAALEKDIQRATGRVSYLSTLHPQQGLALKRRLRVLREAIPRQVAQRPRSVLELR